MQTETDEGYFQYLILAVVVAFGLLGVFVALWAIMNFVMLWQWGEYL